MIWILVQVHSGIADAVETFTTETAARHRAAELQSDLDWESDNLNLFVGNIGAELEELPIQRDDFID
jgi:hypothetical protein